MNPAEPWRLPATRLVALFREGALSPVEVARACLDRIAASDPGLNAVIARDAAGALAAAGRSEARWRAGTPAGPLDGVPLTVKDNIAVSGLPCAWGSPLFRDHRPGRDETPVARLRAGGAVILGKTNVPEFTLQGYTDNALFGPTRNPWDRRLTPGGSSGGAAAAVASGMGPLALGTDGGGSIRRPASHNGLVGLKPTPGRVPRDGGLPAILLDLEAIGPIARTVADAALAMSAIADPDPAADPLSRGFAPWSRPGAAPRCRILFLPRFGDNPVDPGIADSVARAAARLAALGHAVEEAPSPIDPEAVTAAWSTVAQSGLAWLLGTMTPAGGDPPSPTAAPLRAMAESGRALSGTALFAALDATAAFRRRMAALFAGGVDAILTPAAAALPWPAGESHPPEIAGRPVGPRGHAVFTNFVNLGGLPGIALPCEPVAGLPVGFQLVGAAGSDGLLLSLAAEWEAAHPWADRWPPE